MPTSDKKAQKPSEKNVRRPLALQTPIEKGDDVRQLQRAINSRFECLKVDRQIVVDGEFGQRTFKASEQVALSIGVCGSAQRKLRRGCLSEGTQQLIRRGREATVREQAAAERRAGYRRKLRKRFERDGGEKAVARSENLVGVHEQPAGSNWGPMVSKFIEFTGYGEPVYWCGCLAAWVVVKLGGARIPSRIRLGFARYITEDAQAGRNGLRAVPVAQARAGDIGCLWGGQHIVVVRGAPRNGKVPTREGNTTAPGQSGSQSNGGCVADNERPIGDFDAGIVARPDYR